MPSSNNHLKMKQLDLDIAHWKRKKHQVLQVVSQDLDAALHVGTCNTTDLLWWTHYHSIVDVLTDLTTQSSLLVSEMDDGDWDLYDAQH
jgi:hypothetical protein